MPEHNFTLIIDGPADHKLNELYEAGADDALIGEVDGVKYAEFDREADTLPDAVMSAIHNVMSVDGLRVTRVEPEDLVTQKDIAERLGRSREGVRLLISGARGPGNFPAPISHLRARNRLWRWVDVAAWAGVDEREVDAATLLAAINALLEWHRRSDKLTEDARRQVLELEPVS